MKLKNCLWMVRTISLLTMAIAGSTGPAAAQASNGWGTTEVMPGVAVLDPQTKVRVGNIYEKLPLSFEANRDQTIHK